MGKFACLLFCFGRDRIFEVEDEAISAGRHTFRELFFTVGGNKEQRAHGIPLDFDSPRFHKRLAAALRDKLVLLAVGAVEEFDNAGIGARFRQALAQNFGRDMQSVALKQGCWKFHLGHPQIGDGGAEREIVDGNPDHQTEGEEGIDERPSPFGFRRAEMGVDMERLRIERHVGKQHIVHLRDGPCQPVLDQCARDKILEINAAAFVTLDRQGIAHWVHPIFAGSDGGAGAGGRKPLFTMFTETDFAN